MINVIERSEALRAANIPDVFETSMGTG